MSDSGRPMGDAEKVEQERLLRQAREVEKALEAEQKKSGGGVEDVSGEMFKPKP